MWVWRRRRGRHQRQTLQSVGARSRQPQQRLHHRLCGARGAQSHRRHHHHDRRHRWNRRLLGRWRASHQRPAQSTAGCGGRTGRPCVLRRLNTLPPPPNPPPHPLSPPRLPAPSHAFWLPGVGSTRPPQTLPGSASGPVSITNLATSTNYSEADTCPASLTNGTTCPMYVYFVPTASGTLPGTVTINSNGFFSQVNTVNTTGLASAISLTGAPLSFGNQLVKTTSAAKTVTVKNRSEERRVGKECRSRWSPYH